MTYVPIAQTHVYTNWTNTNNEFLKYREWLDANAGPENISWKWKRGNTVGEGVYIHEAEVATVFRLTFGL